MTELEMIKAFAELEGVELYKDTTIYKVMFYEVRRSAMPSMTNKKIKNSLLDCVNSNYNPLLPNALNCAARDKYMVEISYHTQFDCGPDGSGSYDIPYATASTEKHHSNTPLNNISSEAICLVVIECILKSQGLWK